MAETDLTQPGDLGATFIWQYDMASRLCSHHLHGLSDAECLWQPPGGTLHIHLADDGGWKADWPEHERYDLGPPSIGWLTWHMLYWWSMVLPDAGDMHPQNASLIEWPGSAAACTRLIGSYQHRWRQRMCAALPFEWREKDASSWPVAGRTLAEQAAWLNLELMKNAAEIRSIRFQYAVRDGRERRE